MANILLLNGPNLNLLGTREPDKYGNDHLEDIIKKCRKIADSHGHKLTDFQSNSEHELVEKIHLTKNDLIDFILFNPAAFTHTSIALRDALLAVNVPFIEIHLSNISAREEYRNKSYFSDIAQGCIFGLGSVGYELAVSAACKIIGN
jgi:3-dehydroquinate dehydratase-2